MIKVKMKSWTNERKEAEFLAGAAIALIMRRIIQKVIGNFEALVLISRETLRKR